MPRPRRNSGSSTKSDFHRQTVLFHWALAKLGVKNLNQFKERFQITPDSPEGLDEQTGLHRYFEAIAFALRTVADGNVIPVDRLQGYEQNILEHTQAINAERLRHGQPRIDWKYHQYLALLFTELFLDRYFDDPEALRAELNKAIDAQNEHWKRFHRQHGAANESQWKADWVNTFEIDKSASEQLARLAFWCATGSGKTLLMHVHIRQFRHYHKRAHEAGKWPKLDQVLLITPNDGLSAQHAAEFTQSGFDVVTIGEQGTDGLFSGLLKDAIRILSIHKLQEDHGKTTVATEAFEGCNLVLVDEGHRGAGRGEDGKWLERRDQLSRGGFCIEYSATFKEAIGNNESMRNRYAKSILFDYAYRSFYRDGYGKDFTILNLENDEKQKRYLTAALLLFYQQMRVWLDGGAAMKPFQVDKPLWVFVGHTVAGKAESTEYVSDVVQVLRFFHEFLADSQGSVALIQSLLEEGYTDQNGRNLLMNRLPHIDLSGDKPGLARQIHERILRDIFHGGGTLRVQVLKAAPGELALMAGGNQPFGVVNVGDAGAVEQACRERGIEPREEDISRASLFKGINADDSLVNLLVGSRKFTEGWNSWRVSSIGLMHVGKGAGTQIIQLFGRGVRLRGYRMSLRRSSVLKIDPSVPKPAHLRLVETLQVFGVKATYMKTFRDWIIEEVPEALEKHVWELPVVKAMPERKLKTLRLKEQIEGQRVERGQAFKELGPLVILRPPTKTYEDKWLLDHPTRLNWLPRVSGIVGSDRQISGAIGETAPAPRQQFSTTHVALLKIDELLFGLEAFKATSGLDRLHVDREAIAALLKDPGWYELLATADDMRADRYENREQWQRMAQQLLNAYAKRFYEFVRGRWEAPYIEVADVDERDLLNSPYTIETTERVRTIAEIEQIGEFVKELTDLLATNPVAPWSQWSRQWHTVPFRGHLYQPLLMVGKNCWIKVSPVALNKDEAKFVEDLAAWCQSHTGREVYLLRNQAVSGLGFFQAGNYYPDFLLWLQDGPRQHLAFVDPKGLLHHDRSDPKILFATQEIPRLQTIVQSQSADLTLHAFILSNTKFSELNWSSDGRNGIEKPEIESLGVLFQADDPSTYVDQMMQRIETTAAQPATSN